LSCITEAVIQKFILKTKVNVGDGSAVVTGLLLAFNLPSNLPWWMVVGSSFAIGIGKMSYGGLGNNPFNRLRGAFSLDLVPGDDKLALPIVPGCNTLMPQQSNSAWRIERSGPQRTERSRRDESAADLMQLFGSNGRLSGRFRHLP
jgi:hypothetical protein